MPQTKTHAQAPETPTDRAPETPTDLRASSWGGVLRRTFQEFKADNLTDWAAALTYYAVLSIFPALIVLVSLLGLIGESATQPLIDNLGKVAPGPARDIFTDAIENLQSSQGAAGILFILGLAGALWSASGYVAAFMRASNSIYDVEEGRPIWKTLPVRVGLTIVLLVLLAVSAVAVVLTGGLAEEVGNIFGVGSTAVTVWDIAKWPVLLLVVSFMFAVLYWAAPNVKQPGFRWISPGGVLAVLVWVIASAAFALYVANFSSYNKTYGALGGVIAFLVWLWISNIAVLLGAEFNAELERGRRIESGHPPRRSRSSSRGTRARWRAVKLDDVKRSWPILTRTVREFQEENLTDWAAALTYYAVLSIFPALIALVSIVGLVMDPAELTRALTDQGEHHRPGNGRGYVPGADREPDREPGAHRRAARARRCRRHLDRLRLGRRLHQGLQCDLRDRGRSALSSLAPTAAARDAGDGADAGATARRAGPHGSGGRGCRQRDRRRRQRPPDLARGEMAGDAGGRTRDARGRLLHGPQRAAAAVSAVTPGSLLAVSLWLLASAGFALYVAHFGSYDKTYGTLGGVITFLIWLWIGNLAVLLGQELNAEVERSRQLAAGPPRAERQLQLPPRLPAGPEGRPEL